MISAVDSSVILDVLIGEDKYCSSSEEGLRRARSEGKLIICECVAAEVYPVLGDDCLFNEFLEDWQLHFIPKRVLPDFLIGAHAQIHADRLIARDRGYFRDYFTSLVVADPGSP